jgi:hypothetical protein
MKKIFIIFTFLVLVLYSAQAQDQNSNRLAELPGLIEEALKKSDYQKAADLKREKETREKIKDALKLEDYTTAASLTKSLTGDGNSATPTADSDESIPELEFMNQICYWNETANKLVFLEEAKPELKTSTWGAPGFAQSTSSHVLLGEHSRVSFSSDAPQSFIVRFPESINPKDQFRLVKFEIRGRRSRDRYCDAYTYSAGAFGGGGGKANTEQNIAVTFTKVKPGFYKITPDTKLAPGEYAFDYLTVKMFAFSIQ